MLRQMLRLARHSAIYGLGGLVARMLAVLLLPLYTRYLTASDYGAIETLIALIAVLTVLLRLGTADAFLRYYFVPSESQERSVSFAIASVANVLITIATTVLLVVEFEEGALGVIVGNFTGTLLVYFALVAYRREQLGLQFDFALFRRMEHFGLPLVPSALALWAVNFSNRFFLVKIAGQSETGLYSIGVRVASVVVFVLMAFRTAWPAFAYSIEDDREAKRTYPFVLTYLMLV